MKRLSLILLLAIGSATIGKAQILEVSDTVKTQDFQVPSKDKTPGGWNFNILSQNLSLYSHNGDNTGWYPDVASFYFGFVGGVNQANGVSINMGQSYEIGIGNIITSQNQISKGIVLSIGLGTEWKNYRMTNRQMFAKHDDGSIAIESYPDGANPKFSRIHTWALVAPIKLSFRLNTPKRRWQNSSFLSVGPELYFTPHASLKTKYILDGEKKKVKNNDLHINKVTVGMQAELLINGSVGIYCKYHPFSVLDTDYCPKFNSITTGFIVTF